MTSGLIEIPLAYRQYQSANHWATERHKGYLDAAVVRKNRRVVTMPAAGWEALARILENEAFDRWGRSKGLASSPAAGTASALTAIRRTLAKLQSHPAMRGEMVFGFSAQAFVVWEHPAVAGQLGEAPVLWSLTPTPGSAVRLLEPVFEPNPVVTAGVHQMRFKEGVTYWRAQPFVGDLTPHLGWGVSS